MTIELVISCVVCFVAGYAVGRLDTLIGALRGVNAPSAPGGFFAKTNAAPVMPARTGIEIDARKFVTDIKTDTLVKTQDIQLGKQVVASDDINESVNKLAQLKRG